MFDWKISIVILTFCIPTCALPQAPPKNHFSQVDSFAKTIKYKNDIYQLTARLTNNYSSELLKARAIFIWITDNIKYDFRLYNKGTERKPPTCRKGKDCNLVMAEWESKYLHKILTKKKGICDGYARLFKKMCDIAGLKSEIITGYSKTKPFEIGSTGPVDHAWNSITLDSINYFLDATWAAGACPEDENTGKLTGFVKSYNNYYWLTPFEDLSRNHFPEEAKWIAAPGYSKTTFAANPYYARHIIADIHLISPTSGIIKAHEGDTIRFKFNYVNQIRYLQVNSNIFRNPDIYKWEEKRRRMKIPVLDSLALKKQQYITYTKVGDNYEFDYVVKGNSLYYLELLFDFQRALRFRVEMQKE